MNNVYENISPEINNKINERLERYIRFKNHYTKREIQYSLLIFLQTLPIDKEQVFTIYTNTKLI